MRGVVITEDRTLESAEVPEPEVGAGQVLLSVAYCGICGSDLHSINNPDRFHPGYVMGHEISGEVLETGSGVTGWAPGDRVAVYHAIGCGECRMCTSGASYRCTNSAGTSIGHGVIQGGYAERIAVPDFLLHRLPGNVDLRIGALAEPLAIATHGLNKAAIKSGDAVCILGAGPIGALHACGLAARGIESIVVLEPNETRRAMMAALGFATAGLEDPAAAVTAALGRAPDVVFECSGNESAANIAIQLAATFGRVMMTGRPYGLSLMSEGDIGRKELQVLGAASCTAEEFAQAAVLLGARPELFAALVTTAVGFDAVDAAFKQLVAPGNNNLKVLVTARHADAG